ncbi:MAG: AMP-binding protein, partial [Ignavibacteria bacterium]|nr:AMP-binding protein [Ignavibacteria bacterium]
MLQKINAPEEFHTTYQFSVERPEQFWGSIAEEFTWKKKWDSVLQWNFQEPDIKWFVNGKLNITENCLDRWSESHPDKNAILWEPNNPDEEHINITYSELLRSVCKFSNALVQIGIEKGDRICIYMPMIPELVIAVLACARIGAIHSVVFAGFSALSLSERINDSSCKMVICSDGAFRGNKLIDIKDVVDEAVSKCASIEKVIVKKRTYSAITWNNKIDLLWEDVMENMDDSFTAVEMDSEDPLFILYTSGSTGKPKGVVHSIGGYMIYTAYTFLNVFQY